MQHLSAPGLLFHQDLGTKSTDPMTLTSIATSMSKLDRLQQLSLQLLTGRSIGYYDLEHVATHYEVFRFHFSPVDSHGPSLKYQAMRSANSERRLFHIPESQLSLGLKSHE